MQYYQCKCGESKSWTSMGVASCNRCEKCGSNLAQSPSSHADPVPHTFMTRYDQNSGASYEVCERCYQKRSKLAQSEGGTALAA